MRELSLEMAMSRRAPMAGSPDARPVAGEDRLPVDAIRNLSETGRDIHWLGAKYSAEVGTGQSVGTLPRC